MGFTIKCISFLINYFRSPNWRFDRAILVFKITNWAQYLSAKNIEAGWDYLLMKIGHRWDRGARRTRLWIRSMRRRIRALDIRGRFSDAGEWIWNLLSEISWKWLTTPIFGIGIWLRDSLGAIYRNRALIFFSTLFVSAIVYGTYCLWHSGITGIHVPWKKIAIVIGVLLILFIIYRILKSMRKASGQNGDSSRLQATRSSPIKDAWYYFGGQIVFWVLILVAISAAAIYFNNNLAYFRAVAQENRPVIPEIPQVVEEPIKGMMYWSHGDWQSGSREDEKPAIAYIFHTDPANFVFDTMDGKSVVRWKINMNSRTCGSKHQNIPSIDGYFWLKPDPKAPPNTRWIGSDITVSGYGQRDPNDKRNWSKIVLEVASHP